MEADRAAVDALVPTMVDEAEAELKLWEIPANQIVYHYTTASGVAGILSSGELHATYAECLNDVSETNYGIDIVAKAMTVAAPKSGPIGNFVRSVIAEHRDNLRIFAACFCASGDLLSQWRGYASGGGGYAIGFRRIKPLGRFPMLPVTYGDADCTTRMARCIRWHLDRSFGGKLSKTEAVARLNAMTEILFTLAATSKDGAFKAEAEHRVIGSTSGERTWFRSAGPFIVPFVKIDYRKDCGLEVAEVICGPTVPSAQAKESVQILLDLHAPGAKARRSTIPICR